MFEFTFDSSGALGPLDIPAFSVPDSALRRLAVIVGSNVRSPPRGVSRAGVRIEIAANGITYAPVLVSACKRQ